LLNDYGKYSAKKNPVKMMSNKESTGNRCL